jgi:hypothetical protein
MSLFTAETGELLSIISFLWKGHSPTLGSPDDHRTITGG